MEELLIPLNPKWILLLMCILCYVFVNLSGRVIGLFDLYPSETNMNNGVEIPFTVLYKN